MIKLIDFIRENDKVFLCPEIMVQIVTGKSFLFIKLLVKWCEFNNNLIFLRKYYKIFIKILIILQYMY